MRWGSPPAGSALSGVPSPGGRGVGRVSSLTIGEVTRSRLRDAAGEVSHAQRAQQLRRDLGVEQGAEGQRLQVPGDVLFGFDQAHVRDGARPLLAEIAELIRLAEPETALVAGHTDAVGSRAYNRELSRRRAQAVADVLADAHDVSHGVLETVGFGERRPVAPNRTGDGRDDPQGRARNRRVEIRLEG